MKMMKFRMSPEAWKKRVFCYRAFYGILQRCNNPRATGYRNYGGRGIRCLITAKEIEILYDRDKGWKLWKPSIDRVNPDGDYEWSNVRVIELSENCRRKRGPRRKQNTP